jgi:hypothetical protein
MKSTKFCHTIVPNVYQVWSHRKFRGYVTYVEEVGMNLVSTYVNGSTVYKQLTSGWRADGPDGTPIHTYNCDGGFGYIFENRRKAAIRLLTDHRFSGKVDKWKIT